MRMNISPDFDDELELVSSKELAALRKQVADLTAELASLKAGVKNMQDWLKQFDEWNDASMDIYDFVYGDQSAQADSSEAEP